MATKRVPSSSPSAIRSRAWRAKNAAHVQAYNAQYRLEHHDEIIERNRDYRHREHALWLEIGAAYRAKNRLRIRAWSLRWAANNRDKKRAQDKASRARHKDAYLLRARLRQRAAYLRRKSTEAARLLAWRHANPEKSREQVERRRARKAQAPIIDFTEQEWRALCKAVDYRCCYCGKQFPMRELTEDHLTPLGPEGSHTLQNILPCCLSCNSRKGIRNVLRPVQPFLLLDDSAAD